MPRMSAIEPGVRTLWSERALAAATHLSFPIAIIWAAVNGRLLPPPFLLVPLVCACWISWSSRRAQPFVRRHARESINLQVSVLLAVITFAFLLRATPLTATGSIAVFGAYVITAFVQACVAAWNAGIGRGYRLPFALRLLR
jgi:uncharacterized Tic20 family protein